MMSNAVFIIMQIEAKSKDSLQVMNIFSCHCQYIAVLANLVMLLSSLSHTAENGDVGHDSLHICL